MSATSAVRRPVRAGAEPREPGRPRSGPEGTRRAARRWRAAVIAIGSVALAWAFAPFVLVALDAAAHHRVFMGVAGYYPMDGLQYLAWVRDASAHGLAADLFRLTDKARSSPSIQKFHRPPVGCLLDIHSGKP